MSFEQFPLDSRVLAGVKSAGYDTPTPIQQQSIPVTLEGGDVMGLAQTGTGKTAAFLLPILNRLATGRLRQTRALIVAPTRELAEQIKEESIKLSRKLRVRTLAVYGGVGKRPQIDGLQRGSEIVVACPGRLLDLMGEGHVDLSHVEVLVLDEADRMFDMGFLPDIKRIIKQLPQKRQSLFFSATMPKEIRELADDYLHEPETVQIGIIAPAETVTQALYPVPHEKRKELLFAMLPQLQRNQVLIFTRTKYRARNLARDLGRRGYKATALQGNMSQNQRTKAMDGFRKMKYDVMVATDIAARGIDVTNITHVINFDITDTVDAYTHRIGRTGRAEQLGEAFTFATPDDATMIRDIERTLSIRIERRRLPDFDYGDFDPEAQFKPSERSNGDRSRARSEGNNRSRSNRSGGNRNYRGHRSRSNGNGQQRGKRNRSRQRGSGAQRR